MSEVDKLQTILTARGRVVSIERAQPLPTEDAEVLVSVEFLDALAAERDTAQAEAKACREGLEERAAYWTDVMRKYRDQQGKDDFVTGRWDGIGAVLGDINDLLNRLERLRELTEVQP